MILWWWSGLARLRLVWYSNSISVAMMDAFLLLLHGSARARPWGNQTECGAVELAWLVVIVGLRDWRRQRVSESVLLWFSSERRKCSYADVALFFDNKLKNALYILVEYTRSVRTI